MHVDSARRLPNLVTGGSAGHSLPTMVYDAYCTPSKRLVFSTPTALASELREDSSLGMALLLFKTEPAAGRDRRATDRRTTDVNAAAGADEPRSEDVELAASVYSAERQSLPRGLRIQRSRRGPDETA